ncbi:MAG: amino acid ABC transporter permease [Burkholderiaceae bacterium]
MAESRPPPPVNMRQRATWVDLVVLGGVLVLIAYVGYRVTSVLNYQWDWSVIPGYFFRRDESTASWVANLLIIGLMTTLRIAFWGMIVSLIVGMFLAFARTSKRLLPRLIGWAYVGFIRNIPPVPFLFLFYFFISTQLMPWLGIDAFLNDASPRTIAVAEVLFGKASLISNFAAGVIALSMMMAAYIAEILRAGILSIDKGQYEAGYSIGLNRWQVARDVVLPQAIQRVIPPLTGQLITLIKDSSLVALISIQELSFLAMEIAISEQRFFEVWIVTGMMYFVICYTLSVVMYRLERRANAASR